MNTNLTDIENRLWSAADELRANSRLKASEYSTPVLGLIFLRYADHKFTQAKQEISSEADPIHGRILDPACGSGGMFVQSAAFISKHKKMVTPETSAFTVLNASPKRSGCVR